MSGVTTSSTSTFSDYFLILGSPPTITSSSLLRPKILFKYPLTTNEALLPINLLDFCYETNIINVSTVYKIPTFHTFVCYNAEGRGLYGSCLTIYKYDNSINSYINYCYILLNYEYRSDIYMNIVLSYIYAQSTSGYKNNGFENSIVNTCSINYNKIYNYSSHFPALNITPPTLNFDTNIELFEYLSEERISTLFISILCGYNIVLLSNSTTKRNSILTILRLLFPFKLAHTLLPLCPHDMLYSIWNDLSTGDSKNTYIIGCTSNTMLSTCKTENWPKNTVLFHLDRNQLAASPGVILPQWPSKYRSKLRTLISLFKNKERNSYGVKIVNEFYIFMNLIHETTIQFIDRKKEILLLVKKEAGMQLFFESIAISCKPSKNLLKFSSDLVPNVNLQLVTPLFDAIKTEAAFEFPDISVIEKLAPYPSKNDKKSYLHADKSILNILMHRAAPTKSPVCEASKHKPNRSEVELSQKIMELKDKVKRMNNLENAISKTLRHDCEKSRDSPNLSARTGSSTPLESSMTPSLADSSDYLFVNNWMKSLKRLPLNDPKLSLLSKVRRTIEDYSNFENELESVNRELDNFVKPIPSIVVTPTIIKIETPASNVFSPTDSLGKTPVATINISEDKYIETEDDDDFGDIDTAAVKTNLISSSSTLSSSKGPHFDHVTNKWVGDSVDLSGFSSDDNEDFESEPVKKPVSFARSEMELHEFEINADKLNYFMQSKPEDKDVVDFIMSC